MAVGFEVYRRKSSHVRVMSPKLTEEVRKAVETLLAEEERQQGRMIGGLKDFKSGKFQDAARGILSFVGLPRTWDKAKACTTHGIIAEVKRLCDCPKCARARAAGRERARVTGLGATRPREGEPLRRSRSLLQCRHQDPRP